MHIDRLVLTVALFGIVLNCCASSCSEKVPYSRKAHGCPGEYSNVYPVLVTSLGGAGTHHITCVLDALNISVGHEHLDRDGSVGWQYAINDSFVGKVYPHHAAINKDFFNPSIFSRLFGGGGASSFVDPSFNRVLHVTRCPIKQISSVTTHLYGTYEFLLDCMVALDFAGLPPYTAQHFRTYGLGFGHRPKECAGLVRGRGRITSHPRRGSQCWLHFSAAAWLFWNKLIESYANERFRIEDQISLLVSAVCEEIILNSTRQVCSSAALVQMKQYLLDHHGTDLKVTRQQVNHRYEHCNAANQRSHFHRQHQRYSYDDLKGLDSELVDEILMAGKRYGYDHNCALVGDLA